VRALPLDPWDRPDASGATLDRAMQGVDYAVLLGLVAHASGTNVPATQVAKAVRRRPDRYLGFAGIDPSRDEALDELNIAISLGLVGVVIAPAAQQIAPTEERVMRVLEYCQHRGLPVMVHADTHLAPSRMKFAQTWMLDEVAHALPKLTLIVSQVGDPFIEPTLTLLGKHERVFADLSYVSRQPWPLYTVLAAAHQRGVTEKLLLGSDFPFSTPEAVARSIYAAHAVSRGPTVTGLPDVPREVLASIVRRDTLGVLGIAKPAPRASGHPGVPGVPGDAGEAEPIDAAATVKGVLP
jgi:predicted TIM-barrel fold metal-dependent hydrolase